MALHIFVIFQPYTFVDGINLKCWSMATGWDSEQGWKKDANKRSKGGSREEIKLDREKEKQLYWSWE